MSKEYRRQDEYCEWHRYDGPGPARIVFTAEGPEYWIALAKYDLKRVVALYQKFVSPDVLKEDLLLKEKISYGGQTLAAGTYDPFNIWNTRKGVMHLTHYANTLGAEINLAARATVLRCDINGDRITESRRLIASSGYGSVNRSSDPNIGYGVNSTAVPEGAAKALSITLANPVGLYMDACAEDQLADKDDQPLVGWFKFIRGAAGRGLMAVLQPPEGDARTLGDVYVGGEKLESGAQIAKLIQMIVYAATADLNAPMPVARLPVYRGCVPKGTDLTALRDVNFDESGQWDAGDTCRIQGATQNPPIALDDAYAELLRPSGAGADNPAAVRMTRNG